MNDLQAVTRTRFYNVPLVIYGNGGSDFFMTREQAGQALKYANPQKAIDNIHRRHKDRLDNFSVTLALRATDGKFYDTMVYTLRGVMELCQHSQQPKAQAFMDFVLDVMERLMRGIPLIDAEPVDFLERCGVVPPALPPSDQEVAAQFLQAIAEACANGKYYLSPKMSRRPGPKGSVLLGIYDDEIITLISALAFEIYTGSPCSPSYIAVLRQRLCRAGLALPRIKKDGKRRLKGKEYATMRMSRQAANALPGGGRLQLLPAHE